MEDLRTEEEKRPTLEKNIFESPKFIIKFWLVTGIVSVGLVSTCISYYEKEDPCECLDILVWGPKYEEDVEFYDDCYDDYRSATIAEYDCYLQNQESR